MTRTLETKAFGTGGILALALGLLLLAALAGFPNLAERPWLMLSLGLGTALTAGLGYLLLPWLHALKVEQIIRREGPQGHLKKAGTPTMGGLMFLPAAGLVATGVVSAALGTPSVAYGLALAVTLACGAIGWLDDWLILRVQSNAGLAPKAKLGLQIAVAVALVLGLALGRPDFDTGIALPLGVTLNLGLGFWVLAGFVLPAQTNAVNLTDGLDGLAAGLSAIALVALGILLVPSHADLALLAVSLAGGCLGFLVHNHHPARVFMGDTGSLGLGGALAALGILGHQLWPLLILSLIFLWETVTVILQVSYYKATKGPDGVGKRLFKMTPYHHHLELSGWRETQVVSCFWSIELLLAGLCLVR
ncbi:MAG: phospho-N-acetylmuramoyl-pentapeptide-transferase [Gloeomargaritaceae cyanobacterium C42_A2020_066]|nr:phospho-N-acetylmuramoyl-pentapeptide-transferase [Gloeomargaritaceae cyanobacterium C42_A2020_066]